MKIFKYLNIIFTKKRHTSTQESSPTFSDDRAITTLVHGNPVSDLAQPVTSARRLNNYTVFNGMLDYSSSSTTFERRKALSDSNSINQLHKVQIAIDEAARRHPLWPVTGISAAAFYGFALSHEIYSNIHFATDSHTCTARRKKLPYRFHYLKRSFPQAKIRNMLRKIDSNDSRHRKPIYCAIDEKLGIFNGVLITSPLQTIFDCMRTLPFEEGLMVSDFLAKKFHLTSYDAVTYARQNATCWKAKVCCFALHYIDHTSSSPAQSFCRARMILHGFVNPTMRIDTNKMQPSPSAPFQNAQSSNDMPVKVNFVWNISALKSSYRKGHFPTIVATLDYKSILNDKDRANQVSRTSTYAMSLPTPLLSPITQSEVSKRIIHFTLSNALLDNSSTMLSILERAGVPHIPRKELKQLTKLLYEYKRMTLG